MTFNVYCDGGSRGNPGPAAAGFVIYEVGPSTGSGSAIILRDKRGKYLGIKTNNEAEYQAVVEALSYLSTLSDLSNLEVQFFLDSSLVVNQINGLFKVKEPRLRELLLKVRELEQEITNHYPLTAIRYEYIPREKNQSADQVVNETLDQNK